MIPILYSSTEKDYTHNGIAPLKETIEATVTEEANGLLELYLEYPVNGMWAKEITDQRLIKAKPNDLDEPHVFRIYEIVKNMEDQLLYIYASSITNDLGLDLVQSATVTKGTAQDAMNAIKDNLTQGTTFILGSDIATRSSTDWSMRNPLNCIVGEEGSIVQWWGGELKRTNTGLYLYARRGRNDVSVIRQGKNLEGFDMTVSTQGLITRILPHATIRDEETGEESEIIGSVVNSPRMNNYPVRRIVAVDYTDESITTVAQLNSAAATYFTTRNPDSDKPTVRFNIDMLQLSNTSYYAKFKKLESVGVFDTVTVYVPKFDVNVNVKIRSVEYDVLREKTVRIVAGDAVSDIFKDIRNDYRSIVNDTTATLLTVIQQAANGNNTIWRSISTPVPPHKKGDLWYKPVGEHMVLLQWDGLTWVEILNTEDLESVRREVEAALAKAEEAKLEAENAYNDAVAEAERLVAEQSEAFDDKFETETGTIRNEIEQGVADAITDANNYTNAQKQLVDDQILLIGQEVSNVKDTADSVVDSINTAISNAGFSTLDDTIGNLKSIADSVKNELDTAISNAGFSTLDDTIANIKSVSSGVKNELDIAISNAGFTSLDDTLQNMKYITIDAEQNAQQAITDASNAYDLAQTSISEAQTAQANSLTALGKADNALDGVSNLDIRVDDVEAELELKADNTFMNEDGTLTTLSNAITFNATRFSSDMSRIESRVESLAGEINLVILKGAFESSRLNPGTTYPNPESTGRNYQTMRELITVQGGETLAMSKETSPSGFNQFRFNFYNDAGVYLTGESSTLDQYIVTVPQNATKMWVSYPTGSKPQIVRGTTFVPYRPNLADQMTTDEMVIFRNEYDEYADRTERRLSAIDTTGGSLDVLNNRITSTAEQVTTNMTSLINAKVGSDEFTEFYQNEYLETAQEVNRKISLTDINPGERNLLKDSGTEKRAEASDIQVGTWELAENIKHGEEVTLVWEGYSNGKSNMNFNWVGQHGSEKAATSGGINEGATIHSVTFSWKNADNNITHLTLNKSPYTSNYNMGVNWVKLVRGNISSLDWIPAHEDTQEQISHIESEWAQTFGAFSQTVTGIDGRVTAQKQTIDTMSSTVSGHGDRITAAEQTASGLQTTVADKADQSQVTQLALGLQSTVGKLADFIYNSTFEDGSSLGWEGITVESSDSNSPTKYYAALRQRNGYFGDLLPVEVGEDLSFSITAWNISANPQPFSFGVAYYDKDKNIVSWYKAITTSESIAKRTYTGKWKVSSSAVYVRPWVQIDASSSFTSWFFTNPKVSRVATNSKITQLENSVTTTINSMDGRIVTQQTSIDGLSTTIASVQTDVDKKATIASLNTVSSTVNGHTSTLATLRTDVNGKATVTQFNTLNSTVDGTIARVGTAEGKITQIETNVSGIQSTVANKAGQSQVTQLANVWNASVSKLSDFIFNSNFEDGSSLGWEDISVESFDANSPTKYYAALRQRNGYFGDLIPVEAGERLMFSIHAWSNSTAPQLFTFGVRYYDKDKNHVSWQTAISTNESITKRTYTGTWVVSNIAKYVRPWVQIDAYSDFTSWFFTNPRISRVPTNAQISVLENNINLRVKEGDVVSQFNIDAGRTLISSGKILLDGDTYVMGTTFVNAIKAKSLEAVNADIVNLRTKILTADVITSTHLKVDNALIDKLTVNTAVVDRFFTKTAVIDNLSVKTLDAITANITSIRSEVLVADVVESTHLKADTVLIDKLFATTALINELTSKTAFINNIKAIEISADKITSGTLNSAIVNAISLNVSQLVGETSNFVQSAWNSGAAGSVTISASGVVTQVGSLATSLNAGHLYTINGTKTGRVDANGMQIADSSNGQITRLHSDGLDFDWYSVKRVIEQNSEGLTIRPITGSGNRLNSSLHIRTGAGADKVAYVEFTNATSGNSGRIILQGSDMGIRHPAGGVVQIANYENDGRLGNLRAGTFQTSTYDGRGLRIAETQINVLADNQTLFIMPSGTGELRIGTGGSTPTLWPVRASRFVEGSSRASKTNINPYMGSALDEIKNLQAVTFNRKEDVANGIAYTSLGFIAEDSPFIAIQQPDAPLGVDHYKMVTLAIKGVQELVSITDKHTSDILRIDTFVGQHEQEIKQLKQKIAELERKLA